MKRHGKKSLQWAFNSQTGQLLHINDAVPSQTGLLCPSPECRHPLVPVKNVTLQIPHYKHKAEAFEGTARHCADPSGVEESIIHELGKHIIARRQDVLLQSMAIGFKRYKNNEVRHYSLEFPRNNTLMKLKNIKVEQRCFRSDYQPDLSAEFVDKIQGNTESIIIEICYKNRVKDDRLQKIKALDIAAVEFCLTDVEVDAKPYSVEHTMYRNKHAFKWLHYPERWISEEEADRLKTHEQQQQRLIDIKIAEAQRKEEERQKAEALELQLEAELAEEERKQALLDRSKVDFENKIKSYVQYLVESSNLDPTVHEDRALVMKYYELIEEMQSQLQKIESYFERSREALFGFEYIDPSYGRYKQLPRHEADEYSNALFWYQDRYCEMLTSIITTHIIRQDKVYKDLVLPLIDEGIDISLLSEVLCPHQRESTQIKPDYVNTYQEADLYSLTKAFNKSVWPRCEAYVKRAILALPKRVDE